MADIKNERILSIKIDIEFRVSANNLTVQALVSLKPIIIPNNTDLVFLVVTYAVEPFITSEGTKMNVEIKLPFTLEKRNDITIEDLYTCVQRTTERLQLIFDQIFFKDRLIVPPMEFERIEEKLINHLKDIKDYK